MDKKQKVQLREQFVAKFKEANGAILAEYRGMTVAELSDLRTLLRKANSEFKVIKNRVAKKGAEEGGLDLIREDFKGPCGLVLLKGDPVEAAKVALEFQKDHPKFVLKCGLIDNQRLNLSQLEDISKLPSKEVLLAKILGSLVAPHKGIMGVLSSVPRQLVQVINAIKDKKVG